MKSYTIFEAIPDYLEKTVKVLPFNIKNPSEQWGEIFDGFTNIFQRLIDGFESSQISAIVIGGSIGKGTFDHFSDIDLGVLTKNIASTRSSIERIYGPAETIEDKKTSLSFHYGPGKIGSRRIEIRISPESLLYEMRDKITEGFPLSQIEQDFLANFTAENVIFGNQEIISLINGLHYSEDQANYDIKQNVVLVRDYGFQRLIERQDFALYFYYFSVCKRALINLIYADNRVFHRGYKHESKLRDKLKKYPHLLMNNLDQCFFNPSLDSVKIFFDSFEEYRQSLYRGSDHAIDSEK